MSTNSFKIVLTGLFVAILTMSVSFAAAEAQKADSITCPVSGKVLLKKDATGPYTLDGTAYYFCCSSCLEKFKADPGKFAQANDPLCGMSVDKKSAQHSVYKNQTYYFCNAQCKTAFDKNPEKYAEKVGAADDAKKADCCRGCQAKPCCSGKKN
ncbi:YHS domain-containing protein [candidate division KSB1 bacterium]|nr:YHS domain-containing protein [candidate division KSB1 bacterium]